MRPSDCGDDNAVLGHVVRFMQHDRGFRMARAVIRSRAQVDVGDVVAADHDERRCEAVLDLLDGARAAEQRLPRRYVMRTPKSLPSPMYRSTASA